MSEQVVLYRRLLGGLELFLREQLFQCFLGFEQGCDSEVFLDFRVWSV